MNSDDHVGAAVWEPASEFSRITPECLREALFLTSLFAEIDYAVWIGEFLRLPSGRFRVPQEIHLEKDEILRQYELKIGARTDEQSVNAIEELRRFFADDGVASTEFQDAFARLHTAAKPGRREVVCDKNFKSPFGCRLTPTTESIVAPSFVCSIVSRRSPEPAIRTEEVVDPCFDWKA